MRGDLERASYDFDLPDDRVAQEPPEARGGRRSDVRLLVLDRGSGAVEHAGFGDLARYLHRGDTFVVNDARVVPSVLHGVSGSGRRVVAEIFSPIEDGTWECMVVPEQECREGAVLTFGSGALTGRLVHEEHDRVWRIALDPPDTEALEQAADFLYPYYLKAPPSDSESYQTVYGSRPGSTGLPSAGRHITHEMLDEMAEMGVAVVRTTLFIALRWTYEGFCKRFWDVARPSPAAPEPPYPFRALYGPPRAERYEVSRAAADTINSRRRDGGRVVVCGTSALRTLETVADPGGHVHPGTGWTSVFIAPGHRFRACEGFLTNFHMPMSTELLLTSAFIGSREKLLDVYRDEVLARGYAFHEFGDSMLVIGEPPPAPAAQPPVVTSPPRDDPSRGLAGG